MPPAGPPGAPASAGLRRRQTPDPMIDPALALLVFAALVAVAAVAFWPDRGVVPRLFKLARLDERVRLEDTLKHVYTCERRGQTCTLESVAGRLEISTGRAATLLSRLAEMGLVRTDGPDPRLTDEGRHSALRIVRTHRLWERYLADRTGVPAARWHEEAERMEHALSEEQTEALSARLGHPRWDPHGDPIPTPAGDLPPFRGTSLMEAESGQSVEVVHLEDEPRELYQSLVSDGLAPGSRLDVVERGENEVRVQSAGREWSLDPVAARNVTVRILPVGEGADGPRMTLRDVPRGQTVRVVGLTPDCQGTQRRRLLDLGVVKGTLVTPRLRSAAGDPVAYEIRGALIALRKEQADWVAVEEATDAEREEVA